MSTSTKSTKPTKTRASGRAPGQWWDSSLTPQDGCHWPEGQVPAACVRCWAKRMARRWGKPTEEIVLHPERLAKVSTRGPAKVYGVPINCGDVFQADVSADFVWGVLGLLWQVNFDRCTIAPTREPHRFIFVTKRPARAVELLGMWLARRSSQDRGLLRREADLYTRESFLLMFSAWDQSSTDAACAAAAKLPEGVRWGLHLEPLLAAVDLSDPLDLTSDICTPVNRRIAGPGGLFPLATPPLCRPSWIVVGGENGPGARPMDPAWARRIRDQCVAAGVSLWFKGWGAWVPEAEACDEMQHDVDGTGRDLVRCGIVGQRYYGLIGRRYNRRLLDGREHDATPWARDERETER